LEAPAIPFFMALGAFIIKACFSHTDEELVEQIKENLYLQSFICLEAFHYLAPFDPPMIAIPASAYRKPCESWQRVDCALWPEVIRSSDTQGPGDNNGSGGGSTNPAGKSRPSSQKQLNQCLLLIDATCAPLDICHPTDLLLRNEASE
jgi:IS5 family transposase